MMRRRVPQKKRWNPVAVFDAGKFKAWLKAKPAKEIVGVRCEAGNCPLANFHNNSGTPPYRVKIIADEDYCVAETQEGEASEVLIVPYWVQAFVDRLDDDIEEAGDMVTAQQALKTLEGVVR